MNHLYSICIATLMVVTTNCVAAPVSSAAFFIAPDGSNTNPGTKAKPFATLERARDAVRELKKTGPLKEPVAVYLRGGVYRVEKAIEFLPEDSGTERAPITYAAFGNERPVISGGRQVLGWRKGDDKLWQTTVPAVKEGRWYFNQLFVNGQRRTRARTPNQGFLYTEGILAPFNRSKWWNNDILAKRGFVFRNGDIKRWRNFNDALIVIYHSWTTSMHLITELDEAERTVRLAPISRWPIGYWWEWNTRYHVENIPEALDSPGEWYLDRATGVLSYWPMPGENMRTTEVIAPVVKQTLVAFKGVPVEKRYVEHLRFAGISFQHTDCHIAPDMPPDEQGAIERKPLIAAEGLRHTVFENCEIAHAGENGLWLDSGCADNVIRGCHIHDLGGSAVFIGPKVWRDTPELRVERNVVDNCFIHDGSRLFLGSQGVWIGRSSFNQVTHNEISDFHHLGISVGHSWGYAPSSANHNLIAFNHVHHICNGYFSDGGGIYTLGISPGTVIANNIVHDVVPTPLMPQGGTGIYHDEGSTGILVESNIVYRVGIPYHQHYGRENLARNNIFAFALKSPVTCARPEEHLSYTFESNIVLSSGGQATSDHYNPMKCKTEFRNNLYWDISGKEPLFSSVSFTEWQRTGRDRDSRVANPQFYDAAHGDFRLKKTSPALAMGFRPIDANKTGLYGDAAWVNAPKKIKRALLPLLPPLPPAPPPRPFREDFESTATGKHPDGFHLSPDDRPELMCVTEETAASGKKSLKFTEAANLKYGFQPHLFYTTRPYTNGVLRFACDICNSAEHPSECFVGLRDYTQKKFEYREGPSIVLRADGTLTTAGKPLAKLPLGKWIHLDIQINLSNSAPQSYRLAVTVAGEKEQVFESTPYFHPEFSQLTWFGFSSSGKPGAVFYIDNIRLEAMRKDGGK
ncbi:MAG: right-handed parallel beta-helix repeat-containing protein [Verrucomicrobia bacterium]|nr:right-handed parallel beta-helix repeat-containing protein [Verrucomicrobiota bacterium]